MRYGLAGLSVNRVVAEAGVAKGTFYVHFEDRDAFVDALHERFHAHVQEAVEAASAGVPPGAERIVRGAEAYLDVCLVDRGSEGARARGAHGPVARQLDGRPPRSGRGGSRAELQGDGLARRAGRRPTTRGDDR